VQCLEIELLVGLGRHTRVCWTLYRFRNSVSITEVVLMRLPEWLDVERRYLPGVVTQLAYRTSKVVGAHTHLDADQARWHVGKSCNDFVASNLLVQDYGASGIETNYVIVFLPGSMPIVAIMLVGLRDMGVLLLDMPPSLVR
jgi:hypothetical protein